MKSFNYSLLLVFCVSIFTSCLKDECQSSVEVFEYEPVYLTLEEIQSQTISTEAAFPLKNPGKIFYQGDILFVSERGEGVHIFDNSDKANPTPVSFLRIPGNIDVSFKNNHLIADSYMNILIINLADLDAPEVVAQMGDVKESPYFYDQDKEAYIVDYVPTLKTREISCNHPFFDRSDDYFFDGRYIYTANSNLSFETIDFSADGSFNNSSGGAPGVAGSLSSFALVDDYFYYINGPDVHVYNIKDLQNPFFTDGFEVAWNIETLFPYKDNLFIGGQNGMYIYDNSNPASPQYLAEFVHARACDPVFVEGTTAYVTLSEGNTCTNFVNQLDVIDISNITEPTLIKSYPLFRPKGLSVYDNTLFVCDDKAGIKIFDATDKATITQNRLSTISGVTFIEVIHISPTEILAVGPEGIFQYNVADAESPQLLSHIEVVQ